MWLTDLQMRKDGGNGRITLPPCLARRSDSNPTSNVPGSRPYQDQRARRETRLQIVVSLDPRGCQEGDLRSLQTPVLPVRLPAMDQEEETGGADDLLGTLEDLTIKDPRGTNQRLNSAGGGRSGLGPI